MTDELRPLGAAEAFGAVVRDSDGEAVTSADGPVKVRAALVHRDWYTRADLLKKGPTQVKVGTDGAFEVSGAAVTMRGSLPLLSTFVDAVRELTSFGAAKTRSFDAALPNIWVRQAAWEIALAGGRELRAVYERAGAEQTTPRLTAALRRHSPKLPAAEIATAASAIDARLRALFTGNLYPETLELIKETLRHGELSVDAQVSLAWVASACDDFDFSDRPLEAFVSHPGFVALGPKDRLRELERFLRNIHPPRFLVPDYPNEAFARFQQPYRVEGPVPEPTPSYSSANTAVRYEVVVGDRRIPVTVLHPDRQHPNFYRHSITEIARGLASVPPGLLGFARSIELVSPPDPAVEPDATGGAAYMSAGDPVSIYPRPAPSLPFRVPQRAIDAAFALDVLGVQETVTSILVHELGHNVMNAVFALVGANGDSAKGQTDWSNAVQADASYYSVYGALENSNEDFAETVRAYTAVIGTPSEAKMRALMPNRFALLDKARSLLVGE